MFGYMHLKDKVFNVTAIGVLFGIAALNWIQGYNIHLGQNMELIELRPSYSARLRQSYDLYNMSPQEKQEFLKEQLAVEEEKAEVSNYLRSQEKKKKDEQENMALNK